MDAMPAAVRFLLSNNLPGSVTRITADTAMVFVGLGVPTTVEFPLVNWWDHKLFMLARGGSVERVRLALGLAAETAVSLCWRRRWCGLKYHDVDPRVRTRRFLAVPSARDWRDGEVAVVHPPYLVPHLLRTLPHSGVRLVAAIHVNLEKAMTSPVPHVAAWYRQWVARERLLTLPRYTTSEESRAAAERLGVAVHRVIPNGIDLRVFHPDRGRGAEDPIVVTLYCDPNAQKGQAVGLEALRGLKSTFPEIRLWSIGRLAEGQTLFDRNYGYLHREAYANALRKSDIVVYPSLYDGFPAPPLQAMASGAALVSSAVGGLTEYARDGENCLLCAPGDAQSLRRQIVRLIESRELRDRLKAEGPATAERFGVDRCARELLAFLTEVCAEPAHGRR